MPRSTPRARRRGPAVLVLLVLVVAAGLFVWWRSTDATAPTASGGPISVGTTPATTEPAGATGGPAAGSAPAGTSSQPSPTSPTTGSGSTTGAGSAAGGSPADVRVAITYAGWDDTSAAVVVAGYVSGVIEDGGTCTATVTRDGTTLTARVEAIADAATSSCGQLTVPGATSGTWSAVLDYRSGSAQGRSEPIAVEIP